MFLSTVNIIGKNRFKPDMAHELGAHAHPNHLFEAARVVEKLFEKEVESFGRPQRDMRGVPRAGAAHGGLAPRHASAVKTEIALGALKAWR
ncbi:hypothetical protein [Methylocystis hirsuta]|uniref:hypothetical protein n=1 Tax=Methylocystis hirsuta TaxID=369798 RepID=UPI0011CE18C6|nr:hypothetical protein [Methylocystis hirsuta]